MLDYKHHYVTEVISYGEYRALRGDQIHGENKVADFFYRFWSDLEHPTRANIRPRDLKSYLDQIVLLDVDKKGPAFSLNVRLIGSYVAGYYGEISGKDIRQLANKGAVDRIYEVSKMIIDEKHPILTVTPGFDRNRQFLKASSLYMPLFAEENDTVEKIMVSVDIKSMNTPSYQ